VELVSINLRLAPAELEAIDKARPANVPRTWWIRGAIRQRLGMSVPERPPVDPVPPPQTPLPPRVPQRPPVRQRQSRL